MYRDLREWLARAEALGDLERVQGAHWDLEIGGITEVVRHDSKRPRCLLFDNIPGYQPGFRVLANLFVSVKRIALTLGLPENTTEIELVRFWRNYFKHAPTIEPTPVETGPVLENVFYGGDIDLLKISTPRWQDLDGGY